MKRGAIAIEGHAWIHSEWPVFVFMLQKMHLSRPNSRVFSVELGNWQGKSLWNTDPFKQSVAGVQSKVILWEVSAFWEYMFKKSYWICTLGNYPCPLLLSVKLCANCKSIGAWDSLHVMHCGGRFCVNSLWRHYTIVSVAFIELFCKASVLLIFVVFGRASPMLSWVGHTYFLNPMH